MRRAAIILLILVLSFLLPASVLATDKIEIIHQPQNMIFPEHASANWSVEALPIIQPNPLMKTIRGRSGLSVTAMAVTIAETPFSSTVSEVRLTVRRFIASYQIKREV